MLLGGLQKTSLIDYPGNISCIVFTLGCNFRCPFCHNRELVIDTEETPALSEDYFFGFLKERKGKLDGVVITGGEPLIHEDIEGFMKKIKSMGFLVKLDTNGSFPGRLKDLIDKKLVDYIAMDVKAVPEKYGKSCGVEVDPGKIKKSVKIIMESGVDYEFRTTAIKDVQDRKDFSKIAEWLEGADKYCLQKFLPQNTLDEKFKDAEPYTEKEMEAICGSMKGKFDKCEVRA